MTGSSIISLTTDFGLRDTYVGVMKAVILGIAPDVKLVDLTHEIQPQAVSQAAFLVQTACRYFPAGTIHLAVVDPGVGSERRAIAVKTASATFVGPDNGLFAPMLSDLGVLDRRTGRLENARGVELDKSEFHLRPVSQTFHGRDIFAPAAAHLAAGAPLDALGSAITQIRTLSLPEPSSAAQVLRGAIVHIDRFGNAITNIPGSILPIRPIQVCVGGYTLPGVARNYQEFPVAALIGSSGFLELAVRNGSAAGELGLAIGDVVKVQPDEYKE